MMGVYNDVVFTEAVEQVGALIDSDNSDEIATRIEEISKQKDLALVCLMPLVMKAKGIDIGDTTGVEMANTQPSIMDLILPPGVRLE